MDFKDLTDPASIWGGTGSANLGELYAQWRPVANGFVGGEFAMFYRRLGTELSSRNYDQIMFNFGGDGTIAQFADDEHGLDLGGQVEFGRIGGGSFDVPAWAWSQGGSILLTYFNPSRLQVRFRGSFTWHRDWPDRERIFLRGYRLWGIHIGVQYRLGKC